jgi:hypothetical protein
MSKLIYIASNSELKRFVNPHYKTLSVNQALEMGMEVQDELLADGFDRNKPDVLLWSDKSIVIDTEAGTHDDGDFDDDFSIFPINKVGDYALCMMTDKTFASELEWWRITEGRTKLLTDYIRRHLAHTDEVELWYIWLSNDFSKEEADIRRREVSIDELSVDDLRRLEDLAYPYAPHIQYCLAIKR